MLLGPLGRRISLRGGASPNIAAGGASTGGKGLGRGGGKRQSEEVVNRAYKVYWRNS